jgi:hypothetical protein
MKRLFNLVAVLAVTVLLNSSAFAAVSLVRSAVANFSSVGEISFSLDLKYIADDSDASVIDWDVANIPLTVEATNWTTSTVYAVLSATVTTVGSAVYMYQDNVKSTVYKSTAPRGAYDGTIRKGDVYSGMVNKATQGGDYRGYVPMVFTSTTTKTTPSYGTDPEDVAGTRYFIDKSDYNFAAQTNYITVANTGGLVGGVTAEGPCWNMGSNTGYMYFGGKFDNILGGDEYGTDQIKVVSMIE